MKKQIRLLGLDDSPFRFSDEKTSIIGVVMRADGYIECVLRDEITIDGNDATSKCIDMIKNTRHYKQIKAILLDGIALGGFNTVNIKEINLKTKIPIITITRDEPNFEKMKKVLIKKFKDWEYRWENISKGELCKIKTKHNPIYVKSVGIDRSQTEEIIKLSTIRGVIPEPIRVAHIIASGITRGESYGKA